MKGENGFKTFRSAHPLKLTWAQSRLLEALRRPGGPYTIHDILNFMHGRAEYYGDPHVIAVHICRMRKLLAAHDIVIANQKGRGYSISATDRLKIDALLAPPAPTPDPAASAAL